MHKFYIQIYNALVIFYSARLIQGRDQGLFVAPLYFNRAGYVGSDALNSPGSNGYFWSSTVGSSSYAYFLSIYSTIVNPVNNYYRYFGRPVRCMVLAVLSQYRR